MKQMLIAVAGFATVVLPAMNAQPGAGGSWVQGAAYEKTGEVLRALPRVFVSISSPGGDLLATNRTDGNGRYQFVNLPQGRFVLEASKPGYLTRPAAGRAGSRIVVECSSGCRQSGMDFELFQGALVAGVVLNASGEPVSRAVVSLRRVDVPASKEERSSHATDDLGGFRIAGLRAGKYILTVQRRAASGHDAVLTKALTLAEGERLVDLALTVGSQESFRLTGSLSGIPFGEGYRTWVEMRPVGGSAPAPVAAVGANGRFHFDSVIAGRYVASAVAVGLGQVERNVYMLDVLEVVRDTDGIVFQPVEPAAVEGTVEVAAGALPPGAVIQFTSGDGFGYRWTRVRAADRHFELTGLRPGAYRIEADSTAFYVKGVKNSEGIERPSAVILSPGRNRLAVVAAADQAVVFGTVQEPKAGSPLPHARIGLKGDLAEYSAETDQAGRFLFGKVIPGEYRICAWANLALPNVEDNTIWERPGCQSRTVSIDPFSRFAIDVPATP